jgi:hypothetical protein
LRVGCEIVGILDLPKTDDVRQVDEAALKVRLEDYLDLAVLGLQTLQRWVALLLLILIDDHLPQVQDVVSSCGDSAPFDHVEGNVVRVESSSLRVNVEGMLGPVRPTLSIRDQALVCVLRLCEAVIELGVVSVELVNDLHLSGP